MPEPEFVNVLLAENGVIAQGEGEEFAYLMRFRDATTIVDPETKCFDAGGDDVSVDVLVGVPVVVPNTPKVLQPVLRDIERGNSPYRLVCWAWADGNKQAGVLIVHARAEGEIGGI